MRDLSRRSVRRLLEADGAGLWVLLGALGVLCLIHVISLVFCLKSLPVLPDDERDMFSVATKQLAQSLYGSEPFRPVVAFPSASPLRRVPSRVVAPPQSPQAVTTVTTPSAPASLPPTSNAVADQQPASVGVNVIAAPAVPGVGGGSGSALLPVVYYCFCHSQDYQSGIGRGGAQGEVIVGNSLLDALRQLGYRVFDGMREPKALTDYTLEEERKWKAAGVGSPGDFFPFSMVFIDPWTYPDVQRDLPGVDVFRKDRTRVVEFFGTDRSHVLPVLRDRGMSEAQYVNPYPGLNAWNGFLGFSVQPNPEFRPSSKANQGVVWGKETRYLQDWTAKLTRVAQLAALRTTLSPHKQPSPDSVLPRPGPSVDVQNLGHLDKSEWRKLLAASKFVLGLGDPVLGPTAMEALASGCVYINPVYPNGGKLVSGVMMRSQHDFLMKIGKPYVCNFDMEDEKQLLDCVRYALSVSLPPNIPADFQAENHLERVKRMILERDKEL